MKRWKKVLLGVALLVVAVGLAFGGAIFMAFRGAKPTVDGEVLAPGVWTIKDGFVNVFALETGDGGVVLIDAGNDPTGHALLAGLHAHGFDAAAVRAIFVTHGHPDHIAGVHLFPHATVYGMAADAPLLAGTSHPRALLPRMMPHKDSGVRFANTVRDDETVTVGSLDVHAYATPGHTDGSVVYFARGVLFFGDAADASAEGNVRPAKWLFSDNQAEAIASLQRLAARLAPRADDVRALAFAHSGSLRGLEPLARFARTP